MDIKIVTILLWMIVFHGKIMDLYGADFIAWTINMEMQKNISIWFRYAKDTDRLTAAAYSDRTPDVKYYYEIPIASLSTHEWIWINIHRASRVMNRTLTISILGLEPWHPPYEGHPCNTILLSRYGKVDLSERMPGDDCKDAAGGITMEIVIWVALILGVAFNCWAFSCWALKRLRSNGRHSQDMRKETEDGEQGFFQRIWDEISKILRLPIRVPTDS